MQVLHFSRQQRWSHSQLLSYYHCIRRSKVNYRKPENPLNVMWPWMCWLDSTMYHDHWCRHIACICAMAASGHSVVRAFSLLRCGAQSWYNRMIAATASARKAPLCQETRFVGQSASRSRWHGHQISVCRHFGSVSSSRLNWRGGNGGKRGLLHPRSQTALIQGMI